MFFATLTRKYFFLPFLKYIYSIDPFSCVLLFYCFDIKKPTHLGVGLRMLQGTLGMKATTNYF